MWTGRLNIIVGKGFIIGFTLHEPEMYPFMYGETQWIGLEPNESADEFVERLLKRYPYYKKLFDGRE